MERGGYRTTTCTTDPYKRKHGLTENKYIGCNI
jgi:hypothetical protein